MDSGITVEQELRYSLKDRNSDKESFSVSSQELEPHVDKGFFREQ